MRGAGVGGRFPLATFSRPCGTQRTESSVADPGTEVPSCLQLARRGSVHKAIEPNTFPANLSRSPNAVATSGFPMLFVLVRMHDSTA